MPNNINPYISEVLKDLLAIEIGWTSNGNERFWGFYVNNKTVRVYTPKDILLNKVFQTRVHCVETNKNAYLPETWLRTTVEAEILRILQG